MTLRWIEKVRPRVDVRTDIPGIGPTRFIITSRGILGLLRLPTEPHAIVSAIDPGSTPIEYRGTDATRGVLRQSFHDINKPYPAISVILPTVEHGKVIWDFAQAQLAAGVRTFICQCEAGVCRSAGMALGLIHALDGDRTIRDQRGFTPNTAIMYAIEEAAKASQIVD